MKRISLFLFLSFFSLFVNGCIGPDISEFKRESERALNVRFQECINIKMTKSDLMMQVGYPTAKQKTEDGGEIWIYDIVDRGATTTTGYMTYSSFYATSETPTERSRYIIRFNKKGEMIAARTFGPARGAFRFLRATRY